MNVLVVGATGFIGEVLCRELSDRGHAVTALSRSPDEGDLPESVRREMGDVTAYDSIESAFEGQDVVVNLVALSPLFRPDGGDRKHFEIHLQGTENVVEAAKEHGVPRVIQMSGIHADPDGETAYLQAKGQAEKVVESSGLDYVVFRPTVVFGEGAEFLSFTKTVAPRPVAPLPGGGGMKFQPVWLHDLVPMVADAVEDDSHDGSVYRIGGPEVLTLEEIAEMIHAADGHSFTSIPIPMAFADVGLSVLGALGGPMGKDQARALRLDLVFEETDVDAFGYAEDDLTTLGEFLGLEEREGETVPAE